MHIRHIRPACQVNQDPKLQNRFSSLGSRCQQLIGAGRLVPCLPVQPDACLDLLGTLLGNPSVVYPDTSSTILLAGSSEGDGGRGGRRLSHLLPLHQRLHPRPTDPLMFCSETRWTERQERRFCTLRWSRRGPSPTPHPPPSRLPNTPTHPHAVASLISDYDGGVFNSGRTISQPRGRRIIVFSE